MYLYLKDMSQTMHPGKVLHTNYPKQKKGSLSETLSLFAPPQGLEPWTYGLTVRRSNQLSYGGILVLVNYQRKALSSKGDAKLYYSL